MKEVHRLLLKALQRYAKNHQFVCLLTYFVTNLTQSKKPFYLIIRLYMGDFKRLMTN